MAKINRFNILGCLFTCMLIIVPVGQAVTLNVLEWEGYISDHKNSFEEYAKSKGLDVKLNIIKPFITNPEQIFQKVRLGKADVTTPTHNYYKMRNNQLINVLQPIDTSKLNNYKNVTKSLRSASYDKSNNNTFSIPLLGGSYGLAYNKGKGVPEPTSWNILWDPKYKNKFAITSDQFEANLYVVMTSLGYPPETFYNMEKNPKFNKQDVQSKLNDLVKNANSFWGGLADPEAMMNLELVTTYWFGPAIANKNGQNWQLSSPKEGQTVWLDTMALAKHLKNDPQKLEAAYLLLDHMISPKVQAAIFRAYGSVIVNPKADTVLSAEEVVQSHVGDDSFFEDKFFWKPLTARTKGAYQQMWEAAQKARQ
jgi:spermidine/putrescine-binding protein